MSKAAATNTRAFLTLQQGREILGTLQICLYDDVVPKTCNNFTELLQSKYKGTIFHRIISGFMAQGGDYENGDGTGGKSIYGNKFNDENFHMSHSDRGILSMANAGRNTNGSQFFISFRAIPHLDGKHVVFGTIDMKDEESRRVMDALENSKTSKRDDMPLVDITVCECGVIPVTKTTSVTEQVTGDNDEIDLDDEEGDDVEEEKTEPQEQLEEKNAEKEIPDEEIKIPEKMNPLQQRLFKLRLKMNQSRRMNRSEVMAEGSRFGSEEGKAAEKKRLKDLDRKTRKSEWQEMNEKSGGKKGGSHLFETSSLSQAKATRKQDRAEINRFEANDYYNPEGQHRNYSRNIKSFEKMNMAKSTDTYDPLSNNNNDAAATNTEGARRLANELKLRGERTERKKREKSEIEGDEVSYINKRNKMFNKKIDRNYGKYTAEIKQNLERGTAL